MTDDSVTRGRIFNHRDGMSELRRFDMEQDVTRLAEEIVTHCKTWTSGDNSLVVYVDKFLHQVIEKAKRDAIVEFFEGEDSKAAQIEAEGYLKGQREALLRHAEKITEKRNQWDIVLAKSIEFAYTRAAEVVRSYYGSGDMTDLAAIAAAIEKLR